MLNKGFFVCASKCGFSTKDQKHWITVDDSTGLGYCSDTCYEKITGERDITFSPSYMSVGEYAARYGRKSSRKSRR